MTKQERQPKVSFSERKKEERNRRHQRNQARLAMASQFFAPEVTIPSSHTLNKLGITFDRVPVSDSLALTFDTFPSLDTNQLSTVTQGTCYATRGKLSVNQNERGDKVLVLDVVPDRPSDPLQPIRLNHSVSTEVEKSVHELGGLVVGVIIGDIRNGNGYSAKMYRSISKPPINKVIKKRAPLIGKSFAEQMGTNGFVAYRGVVKKVEDGKFVLYHEKKRILGGKKVQSVPLPSDTKLFGGSREYTTNKNNLAPGDVTQLTGRLSSPQLGVPHFDDAYLLQSSSKRTERHSIEMLDETIVHYQILLESKNYPEARRLSVYFANVPLAEHHKRILESIDNDFVLSPPEESAMWGWVGNKSVEQVNMYLGTSSNLESFTHREAQRWLIKMITDAQLNGEKVPPIADAFSLVRDTVNSYEKTPELTGKIFTEAVDTRMERLKHGENLHSEIRVLSEMVDQLTTCISDKQIRVKVLFAIAEACRGDWLPEESLQGKKAFQGLAWGLFEKSIAGLGHTIKADVINDRASNVDPLIHTSDDLKRWYDELGKQGIFNESLFNLLTLVLAAERGFEKGVIETAKDLQPKTVRAQVQAASISPEATQRIDVPRQQQTDNPEGMTGATLPRRTPMASLPPENTGSLFDVPPSQKISQQSQS